MSKRIDLFVIDGQNDFCASGEELLDWPWPEGGRRRGALYVKNADKEALKARDFLRRLKNPSFPNGHAIRRIHASLDSHHRNDGSHNTSWKMPNGASPPPFTIVTNADIKSQKYVPRFSHGIWAGRPVPSLEWADRYTAALEKEGRCPLTLWPVHCQIAKWGSLVYHPLQEAYDEWCETTMQFIDYITKGAWPFTEHYSALRADVIDPSRPETQTNGSLLSGIMEADEILWMGWAGSHCTRWTFLDAADYFTKHNRNEFIQKSVILTDVCAAVEDIPNPTNDPSIPKFSEWRQQFLDEAVRLGARLETTDSYNPAA